MTDAMDDRPSVWTGHIAVESSRPGAAAAFYEQIGMHTVFANDDIAVLELRGGTHLVILKSEHAEPKPVSWDLMVDDLTATHDAWRAAGLPVTEITSGRIHDVFTVTDPDGHAIVVQSTHVVGPV
jgi:hypothetical protein